MTALPTADPWAEFRRQMPIAERWAYFDHAAVAPLPAPARNALLRWVTQATEQGDTVWPEWNQRVEQTRKLAARLIGAGADEIALVRSTTEGISLVAEGFRWQPGDNIVTLANEFPSNQYPWMNLAERGVETRRVASDDGRVDLDRLSAACDAHTRIVSISWVGYASGWRTDLDALAEMAHRRGALLFVDAIQGLGAFPLDVSRTPLDFLAADGHKWLLGPEGAGLLYVRREHLDRLRPLGVGWHSVVHAADYNRVALELKPTAARYEGGSQNMAGFIALAESLELLLHFGVENIGRRILEITDLTCQRLAAAGCPIASPREGEHRSGIVLFDTPGRDPQQVRAQLERAGVVVRLRAGKLRISPHAYCNEKDVDRLIEELKKG
jgi:selenocysteine lyase/cysteine desulfurase